MVSDGVVQIPSVLTGVAEGAQAQASKRPIGTVVKALRLAGTPSHVDSTDELLLSEVAKGSKEALSVLFRRHRRSVLSVADRILKDASEAEDLCQEVFLLVSEKASSFVPAKAAASSWIIQMAYSRALNRRQYLTVRQHYNARELNEEHLEGAHPPLFVDEILARSLLQRLREQLSEEQRSTLELHFFEGYSFREIAEKTGQTIGNVRHHYYRGLERLRSNVFPQKDT